MLKLSESDKRTLLSQPETGMGYQVVDTLRRDNTKKRGIAYNAELFFYSDESQNILRTTSYERVLKQASESFGEFKELHVLSRSSAISPQLVRKAAPANEAPIEKTKANEVFKRFSAFPNDNRLRPDRSWRDGTYATTEEDAKNVKTGEDAVKRYALPNPDPASYVFTGRPHKDTDIQRGIASPAFGQPGGGVEVYFAKGTQPNTVTGPDKIPDK